MATFELADHEGVPVIVAAGEIDISNIATLNELFDQALAREHPTVVLSLVGASYLDSTSFTALGRWSKRAQIFVVQPKSQSVQKLFAIVGLQRVVSLFDSLDAALEAART